MSQKIVRGASQEKALRALFACEQHSERILDMIFDPPDQQLNIEATMNSIEQFPPKGFTEKLIPHTKAEMEIFWNGMAYGMLILAEQLLLLNDGAYDEYAKLRQTQQARREITNNSSKMQPRKTQYLRLVVSRPENT